MGFNNSSHINYKSSLEVQTVLQLAQRVFHMATDFDDAMLQIGGVLSRMSNSEKSVQLLATLKALDDSEFDAPALTKLADSLSQLPKYAMSEEDQKGLTEVFESILDSDRQQVLGGQCSCSC